jgi:hypothetical protein
VSRRAQRGQAKTEPKRLLRLKWLCPVQKLWMAVKELQVCWGSQLNRDPSSFGERAPEERKKIIKDKTMCPFCLLHSTDEVCYTKMSNSKPPCPVPECNGQHIQGQHELLLSGGGVMLGR